MIVCLKVLSTDKMMSFLCADTDERQKNVDLTTVTHPPKVKWLPLIAILAQVCRHQVSCHYCHQYSLNYSVG